MFQKINKTQFNKNVDIFYMDLVKRYKEVTAFSDKWVNVYQVGKMITDEEMIQNEGKYFNEDHYKFIAKEDCDIYDEDGGLILKLRKNVIPEELCNQAVKSFHQWATKFSTNRGAAAGLLDRNKIREDNVKIIDTMKDKEYYNNRFRVNVKNKNKNTGKTSSQSISNLAPSNIVGYMDTYARNQRDAPLPCRLTAYTAQKVKLWQESIPFFEYCDKVFATLVPARHKTQLSICSKTPEFQISNTSFSTATINSSWRTSCHKDAGDLEEGFGNLVVCKNTIGKDKFKRPRYDYEGCYTGFPQYKIAADVRQGDFLAMDVHRWHCNTEFKPKNIKEVITEFKTKADKINYLNGFDYNRLSVVMYYRKNMHKCQKKN